MEQRCAPDVDPRRDVREGRIGAESLGGMATELAAQQASAAVAGGGAVARGGGCHGARQLREHDPKRRSDRARPLPRRHDRVATGGSREPGNRAARLCDRRQRGFSRALSGGPAVDRHAAGGRPRAVRRPRPRPANLRGAGARDRRETGFRGGRDRLARERRCAGRRRRDAERRGQGDDGCDPRDRRRPAASRL